MKYWTALISFCFLSSTAIAEPASNLASGVVPAVKEMVKIGPNGLEPSTTVLNKLDSSVFFVNTTNDSLITVSIDFGKHHPHCASDNLKFDEGAGEMQSVRPIGPKDFAATCFPEAGTYPVTIQGLHAQPVTGNIVVN